MVGVFELMPHANGLSRNVVQCLHDFDIPLHLSTTVVRIHGRDRVDKVTVAPVDEALRPILARAWDVPCDTLLVSIGLIPDNELRPASGLRLDPVTTGPVVASTMETTPRRRVRLRQHRPHPRPGRHGVAGVDTSPGIGRRRLRRRATPTPPTTCA